MFKWSGWNKYTRNKLNQIANGSGGGDGSGGSGSGILVANGRYVENDGKVKIVLDKTFQEIHDADYAIIKVDRSELAGVEILVNIFNVAGLQTVNGKYAVTWYGITPSGDPTALRLITNSPDGYPEAFDGE